ncbi:hypothetical protein SEVIR_3G379632v4 [Setaria viridis]
MVPPGSGKKGKGKNPATAYTPTPSTAAPTGGGILQSEKMVPPGSGKKGKGKNPATAYTPTPSTAAPTGDGILEVIPDPIARLDLSDVSNLHTNYVKCLENITKAVSSDVTFTLISEEENKNKVVPITKGLDHTPNGAFVIELTNGESQLRIVCDKYQIWLRGIVTHNGSRYELDMPGPKAMVGSESLHTTGSYPDLLGDSVNICLIGFQSLLNAFYILVAYGGNTKKHKAAIAVILVMFFEASRLQELHDLSFRLLRDKDDEVVGETNKHLINDWCNTSRDFYKESEGTERVIIIAESTGAATKKVAKSVRILCRSMWDKWVQIKV